MISFKDKILIISNFIFFIALLLSLILRSISFIVFAIIINLFLLYIYFYYNQEQIKIKEELDNNNQAIINNKICVKPSRDNPFMNPSIVDINDNINKDINACYIDNPKIKEDINNHFLNNQYRDVIDIYDRNSSQRQFYTMPSTTIPNNQEAFSKWLYYRKESCKEGNGEMCFYNIM
jgi:regulatory protein YycI of two-component signal transduction system YycFG